MTYVTTYAIPYVITYVITYAVAYAMMYEHEIASPSFSQNPSPKLLVKLQLGHIGTKLQSRIS